MSESLPTNHNKATDAPLGGDDLLMRLMYELHAHLPEDQRPLSLSDLSDEQAARARNAVHAVLAEWESAKAALEAARQTTSDTHNSARDAGGERNSASDMVERVARAIAEPVWGPNVWSDNPADTEPFMVEARAALKACDYDIMQQVIIEANNSLFGSQGFFLSADGGVPDKYHLATPIENLKAQARKNNLEASYHAELVEALEMVVRGADSRNRCAPYVTKAIRVLAKIGATP